MRAGFIAGASSKRGRTTPPLVCHPGSIAGLAFGWLAALATAALAASAGLAADIANPYTGNAAAIQDGRRLWAETGCYSCHGETAEGAVGPDLTDSDWTYRPIDETLFKAIAMGRPGTNMVAWGNQLDPDQIWKIIAYIRSLYKGDPARIVW